MFPVLQSSFLHALGYAIGHSLWQMSLLWLVYFGFTHIGTWSSSKRYALAVSAALAGFVCFLLTLGYYATQLPVQDALAESPAAWPQGADETHTSKGFLYFYHSTMATLRSLAPYLSCAYLVVMFVLSIRLVNGFKEVRQLRTTGLGRASVDWRLFVKDHAALLGIKKPVSLFVSSLASSPLTIGFWKPIILIPLASINHLSPSQVEAILLHELAHIRRHDYLLNIVIQLAEIALFFNPFMRLLLKQARQERENSCDDWVLQFQYNASDYARALLAIEKHSHQSLLAMGSNNGNGGELLVRVKRMVAPERQAFNYRQQLGLLFLITFITLGFTVVSPKVANKKTDVQKEAAVTGEQVVATGPGETTIKESQRPSKTKPAALDLVKALEGIQQFAKVVSKERINDAADNINREAEALAKKIEVNAQPLVRQIEEGAMVWDRAIQEATEKQVMGWQASAEKMAEAYEKIEWEKFLAPMVAPLEKELANFALRLPAGFPAIAFPSPAPSPRVAEQAARAQAQENLHKEKARQLRQLNLQLERKQELRRLLADSIKLALGNMEASLALAAAQSKKMVLETMASVKKMERGREGSHYSFTVPHVRVVGHDETAGQEEGADSPEAIYGMSFFEAPVAPCPPNPPAAPTPPATRRKAPGVSVKVLDGAAIARKIKNEWVQVRQEWDKAWNDEELQLQLHDVQIELQNGLRELEKINIRTQITTKENKNGRTIVIEIDNSK